MHKTAEFSCANESYEEIGINILDRMLYLNESGSLRIYHLKTVLLFY